jgi:hypothetical protein
MHMLDEKEFKMCELGRKLYEDSFFPLIQRFFLK